MRLAAGDLQVRTGLEAGNDDLSELARQVDKSATELERLVAQTRHLSASIAHDLRTPLARLLAQLEKLPEGQERSAALEEAGRLAETFDTIMRVARIEAGQGNEGFEAVDLGDLLAELEETFGAVVEDSGKHLLTKTSNTARVQADRKMLIQAMSNLIQNALVHGGSDVTLFANGRQIGVMDNGPGVAPDKYDEILKPMVRLDAARATEGTGLGLALVRAVADRHGAQLNLSQNTPTGLRITLEFADLSNHASPSTLMTGKSRTARAKPREWNTADTRARHAVERGRTSGKMALGAKTIVRRSWPALRFVRRNHSDSISTAKNTVPPPHRVVAATDCLSLAFTANRR